MTTQGKQLVSRISQVKALMKGRFEEFLRNFYREHEREMDGLFTGEDDPIFLQLASTAAEEYAQQRTPA